MTSRLGERERQLRRPPDGGSLSPSRSKNAAYYAFAADRACNDHMPGCARCGDLSAPGSERCEGCNALLLDTGQKAKPTLAQLAEVLKEEPLPEPERSTLVRYWLEHYTAAEIAEFVAGLE